MAFELLFEIEGDRLSEERRNGIPNLIVLAEVQFFVPLFAGQKLVADDSGLAQKLKPVGEGLDARPFPRRKVPVLKRVNEVGVKGGGNRMALPLRVHSPVVLVVSLRG